MRLCRALQRAQDVQEIGVIALLRRWNPVALEPIERIFVGDEPGAPAFVAEGRIGHHVVEGLECVARVKSGFERVLPCLISAVA